MSAAKVTRGGRERTATRTYGLCDGGVDHPPTPILGEQALGDFVGTVVFSHFLANDEHLCQRK